MSLYMENNKHKVSIILTTYNSKNNLIKSLKSVLRQSYKLFEVLIIDDNSIDNTKEALQPLISKNKSIKYFFLKKNRGVAFARNFGIKKSNYKYIFFLDAGDLWHKSKIDYQLKFMLKLKPAALCSAYSVYNHNMKYLYDVSYNSHQYLDFRQVIKNCKIGFSTSVVDKHQIKGFFFKKLGHEDLDFWLRLLENKKKIYFCNIKLLKYIKYPKSLSSNKLKAAIWQFKIVFSKKNISFLEKNYCFLYYTLQGIRKIFFLK